MDFQECLSRDSGCDDGIDFTRYTFTTKKPPIEFGKEEGKRTEELDSVCVDLKGQNSQIVLVCETPEGVPHQEVLRDVVGQLEHKAINSVLDPAGRQIVVYLHLTRNQEQDQSRRAAWQLPSQQIHETTGR